MELLLVLMLIWLITWLFSLIRLSFNKVFPDDLIFFKEKKSFADVKERINHLEKVKAKKYGKLRNKIAYYENNSLKTRRSYSYYEDKIEPYFAAIYVGNYSKPFSSGWKILDLSLKIYLLYVSVFAIIGLTSLYVLGFYEYGIGILFLALILFPLPVLILLLFIKYNTSLFCGFSNWLVQLFSQGPNSYYKNAAIISYIVSKLTLGGDWVKYGVKGVGIGAGVSSGSFGGGDSFGGFGGGSFGGGGAGGSW